MKRQLLLELELGGRKEFVDFGGMTYNLRPKSFMEYFHFLRKKRLPLPG